MFISTSAMGEANTLIKMLAVLVWVQNYVTQYKKSLAFKESVLQNFWKGVSCTLSALVFHMLEKSPSKYPFARLAA